MMDFPAMFRLEGISPIYLGLSENHAPTIQMISPNYPAIRFQVEFRMLFDAFCMALFFW